MVFFLLEAWWKSGCWTRMERNSWHQSLCHAGCNRENTANAAGSCRKSWFCEWGVGFFPSPRSCGSSNCLQTICPWVTVDFLHIFMSVHLNLLLLPADIFGSNCKIRVHFCDLATEFRNILCEEPWVTAGQQPSIHTLMYAWVIYSHWEKLVGLFTGLKSEFSTDNGIVNFFLNTLYCAEGLK